ncbi:hypothetical protein F2Q69_00013225 [Brassica cretica]|uniref:CCHC-type domain-containing protein n=1 Tax=Brassica cretica TaxID=69181 RepID=A0A8S9QYN8_BRACR|nr:hypothetical protein F2Q69_00013225 [Brassica cretica]
MMAEMVNLQHQALNAQRARTAPNLEGNFRATRCPDEFKKDVAVYYLEKDAMSWWLCVDRYLGDNSVRRYESEFTRLGQYVYYGQEDEPMIIRKKLSSPRGHHESFRRNTMSGYSESAPVSIHDESEGHIARDYPNGGQYRPAVLPSVTCFTCGERGHYATLCPRILPTSSDASRAPHDASSRPPLPFPIPPAKHHAISSRAYALELPGPSGPPKDPITGLFSYPTQCCVISFKKKLSGALVNEKCYVNG